MASNSKLTFFWRFIEAAVVFFAKVVMRWRIDIRGVEHVPRGSGAILAFNHHGYFDFIMVAWAVVRVLRRPVRFLAKREVWQSNKTRWIVKAAGAVPVDRESSASRQVAFGAAIERLQQGELVAVAPEQTISQSFQLLPFRTGAVRMAQAAGVPIVPTIGWGTHRFVTKGHSPSLARHLTVVVRYGEPFHVGPDDDPVDATARLQKIMEGMLDEVQRSYPDRPAPGEDWWVPATLGGGAPPHAEVLARHQARISGWEHHATGSDDSTAADTDPSTTGGSPPTEAAGG